MSHSDGIAQPNLGIVGPNKNLFFGPDPEQADIDDRAFAATGDCDLRRFAGMVKYLEGTGLFQRVTRLGVIVRILHKPGTNWSTQMNFSGAHLPHNLPAVREVLGEQGDGGTALAYVIALLCEGAGWDAADVRIIESPFA